MTDKISASEALYGFMAWLTAREDQITMSRHNDTASAVTLVTRFCELNQFAEPREGWEDLIKIPSLTD